MIIGACSHRGREREHNEDKMYYRTLPGMTVLAVADGMGGHAAGEVASAIAIDVMDRFASMWENYNVAPEDSNYNTLVLDMVEVMIAEVNRRILSEAIKDTGKLGMGTTFTVGVVIDKDFFIGHVGDSRAYIINTHEETIKLLTTDHTLVEDMVKNGKLTREEAKFHSQRHVLTRALGTHPEVKIDLDVYRLQKGEAILLCTDGLTNHIDEIEIKRIVSAKKDPQEAVDDLIEMANNMGGADNITVVLACGIRGLH